MWTTACRPNASLFCTFRTPAHDAVTFEAFAHEAVDITVSVPFVTERSPYVGLAFFSQ